MRFPQLVSLVFLICCSLSFLWGGLSSVRGISFPLELQGTRPETVYVNEGIILLKKGDSKGAEEAFRKSLNVNAKSLAALVGLAEAIQQQGRHEEAQEKLQQALALQPKNGAIQRAWGGHLFGRKEFKKAEAAYLKAIQLNPKDHSAQVDLGNLYLGGLNRPREAAKSFKAAIKLAPHDGNAHFGLGTSYGLMKKTKEALAELHEAATLMPQNPIIHMAIGNLYREQKNYKKALTAYTAALTMEPRYVEAAMAKGDILTAQGYLGEAKQVYKIALELAPNHANVYNNLAWIAAEQKTELDDAVTWAKRAVSLGPSVVSFKDTLAWVHRARGDLRQAAETLEVALAVAGDHSTMTYHLGIVRAEQGKLPEAVAVLKKATMLHLDPALSKDAQQRISALISENSSP